MKTKIILVVLLVLVVAVFTGNWIYGNKMAKQIDAELKTKISKNELPVSISYASISVNPLFSKVKIGKFSMADMEQSVSLNCEEIELDISYKEALRLSESTTFEELNALKIQFNDVEYVVSSPEAIFTVDNVAIDFDGHLTSSDFENINHSFPKEKQKIELTFSNLKVNNKLQSNQKTPFSELQAQISNIDKGKYTVLFNPESKEIEIEDFYLSSSVFTTESNALLRYSGNGFSDFKMISAKMNADYLLKPKDIHWGDEDNGGDFSLSKLSVSADLTMNFDRPNLPEGSISFLAKGLKTSSKGAQSAFSLPFPGLSFEKFDAEKLSINYKLQDGRLTIRDTELKSSLIEATMEADVVIDKNNSMASRIDKAKLVIDKLSPELESSVADLERQLGKTLPRTNNLITLEISGNINNPKIKGLEF